MQRARSESAKDQRRQTLLIAALDEFFDKGFNAARMADIAQRASVSKGTLYLYFESKQDLFRALIEDVAAPTITHTIDSNDSNDSPQSASQTLRSILLNIARAIKTTPLPKLIKVIIADGKNFPELVTFYRKQVIDKVFQRLESLLHQGINNGEWQCSDITNTTRLIIAPIIFSAIWRMVFETGEHADLPGSASLNLEQLFDLHCDQIVAFLTAETVKPLQEPIHV